MTAAVLTVTAMTVAISVYPKPIVDFVKTIVASVF
jgi:hypothetical protein